MVSAQPVPIEFVLQEKDVILCILEFLENRKLHISQVSLERETGLINGDYSEDILFLRQLIIDGQWDNALDFVEPLKDSSTFDKRAFTYLIIKYKFFELLCIKQEPGPMQENDFAVEELVECLKQLEHVCPTLEDYRQLCALLTLPKLSDHADFKSWNPSSARVECFQKVFPLIGDLLNKIAPKKDQPQKTHAVNDRLLQLTSKGVFYEACVDFCQSQALGNKKAIEAGPQFPNALASRPKLGSPDLSLVSWLEVVSNEQFTLPFQQRALDFKFDLMKKPKLEAQWTEQILATPIKPGGQFPHSLVPNNKFKFAEKMSQSMILPAMSMSSITDNEVNVVKKRLNPMSQSTMADIGFSIQREPASENLMQQSQIISNMMEQSEMTKQSRPTNLFNTSVTDQLTAELTQSRRELDQIQRGLQNQNLPPPRTMAQSMLPTVPELPTPTGGVSPSTSFDNRNNDIMSSSRLFQEFNSRRQGSAPVSSRPSSVISTGVQSLPNNMPIPPPASMPGVPQMPTMIPAPVDRSHLRPQSQIYPQYYDSPSYPPSRPQSYVAPPNFQQPTVTPPNFQQPTVTPPNFQPPPATVTKRPSDMGMNIHFVPVCKYEDSQAIRAVSFHPSGKYFVVGTNSKQMLICKYPKTKNLDWSRVPFTPEIGLIRPKQHRGSVYCCGFNAAGDLLATGSNDKTLRLMSFNADECKIGAETELNMHDGTVRDLIFMDEGSKRVLVSGGAGNCNICLTDCESGRTFKNLNGHTAPILGLYSWSNGTSFTSCSQDKTIRFWDLRASSAVNVIHPSLTFSNSPVTSVCVDPSGKLLVSGHEDASIMLFDVTGGRVIQTFRPHGDEVRTVRFSNAAYYLLSGSYDKRVVITDMRGDLTSPLTYLPVAEHNDKIIQCRWHPHEFTFLSTSADRTVALWTLPQH
ncbi:unnamed protein product [Bursaphelenchus okinawaensis]|uniref:CTLH domain-containing protein n=1 Tax=Bursaphelenchus okinawaensis TaxID=465554 RepID=A0A811JS28_9BILA|nr:unnamed protein product [Bursaphelenchus okinawaensis]CAG9080636.1 unnamed protein product [Bursaphelenchus okinawaensis]